MGYMRHFFADWSFNTLDFQVRVRANVIPRPYI